MALPIPGRIYDVACFTGTPVGASGLQAVSVLDPAWPEGRLETGIRKLASRVLLELLTESGTIPYQPDRGTDLLTAARDGLLTSDVAVFQQFAFAASKVMRTLALDQLDSDPADEVLADLELDSVLFTPDSLGLAFTITSAAGTQAQLILPITGEA